MAKKPDSVDKLEAFRRGFRAGATTVMSPTGVGANIAYRLYNRLTGRYPLEELSRRIELGEPPPVVYPKTPAEVVLPEFKRGGLVKKTRTKK